eukprot:tig00021493_g21912.t1
MAFAPPALPSTASAALIRSARKPASSSARKAVASCKALGPEGLAPLLRLARLRAASARRSASCWPRSPGSRLRTARGRGGGWGRRRSEEAELP